MRRGVARSIALVVVIAAFAGLGFDARADQVPPPAAGSAEAGSSDPNILSEQIHATVGFHVIAMRDVDLRAGTFAADFYYWMLRKKVGDDKKDKLVQTTEFMNGSVSGMDNPVEDKDVGSDLHYTCWHVTGTFHFTPDLRTYPFDTQALEIQVENPDLERDYLVYGDDAPSYQRSGESRERWGLKDDVAVYQYDIVRVERGESTSVYRTDFGDPKAEKAKSEYSRFTFRVVVARQFAPYFAKIMLPLLVILGVAYLVFFLPAREIGTASSLAITALLSCIAFEISIAQTLPDVGYMTTSDKFFVMTYLLVFFALVESMWSYRIAVAGQDDRAERLDTRARIVFPMFYVVAMAYLFVDALVLKR